MKNITLRKNINVDKPNLIPIFNLKEDDDAIIKLALFKNSAEFDITGQTVRLGAKTKNGLIEQIDGFTISKNNLDIILKNSILVPGKIEIDLEMKDSNGIMTTASFFITVNQKVLNDEAVEATNEFDTFTKTVDKIESDYTGLRRIIIDENQAASLQDQINNVNSSLEHKANEVDLQVERARIDLLTKIESGETEGNTELLDIRVGADGIEYDTAGRAIREQINSIKKDFGNYVDIVWIENNFIHSWGTVIESDNYDCTDYISYSSKLKYKVRTKMENDLSRLAYYDASKKLIKSVNLYSATLTDFDVEQIENCAYVRFSFFKGRNKTDNHNACYLKIVSLPTTVSDNATQISKIEKEVNNIKEANNNLSYWGYAISKCIMIGDSLTSGAYPTEEWGADAQPNDSIAQNIPYYLKRMLNLDSMINSGKSGFSASNWYISRIQNQPTLYNFADYDCVFIWLGTNNGLTDTLDTDVTPYNNYNDYATTETGYYCKIISRIREQNSDCLIVLSKVFASKGDVSATNAVIDKIGAKYNCLVVDNSDLTVNNHPELHVNNTDNNPHFGKAGNIFVANRYATEISKYLGESPIRCEFGMSKRTDG